MNTTIPGIVRNGVVVPISPLPEGAEVAVSVVVPEELKQPRISMLEFLATLPPGPLLFKTPEEANRHVQEERDSWER